MSCSLKLNSQTFAVWPPWMNSSSRLHPRHPRRSAPRRCVHVPERAHGGPRLAGAHDGLDGGRPRDLHDGPSWWPSMTCIGLARLRTVPLMFTVWSRTPVTSMNESNLLKERPHVLVMRVGHGARAFCSPSWRMSQMSSCLSSRRSREACLVVAVPLHVLHDVRVPFRIAVAGTTTCAVPT